MKIYLAIILLLISLKSFACTCKTKSLSTWQKYELENSECIFIGEIIEVNKSDLTFKIRVTESLDGGDEIGNVYVGKNWKYCSPYVSETGKWIIYGHMESGFLRLNMCGISRPFDNPSTLTSDHTPPSPPKSTNEQNNYEQIRKEYLVKVKKDLELEIVGLRKERDKK
ncbi:hypothetical protein F6U93_02050 [Tamlana haliotis]|uniref:Uncharacterized protein n=2 Tax=Pseudotamlana haliotis TaxID=2614804 RepID=A0A6N6MH97_9FLAO|nr:hypothetical protein F6U93_02050 [Tamlana haliotis]